MERRTAGKAYGRALRLRCPVCGRGRLFRRMTMLKHCAHCGFRYERDVEYAGLPHVLYRLRRQEWADDPGPG